MDNLEFQRALTALVSQFLYVTFQTHLESSFEGLGALDLGDFLPFLSPTTQHCTHTELQSWSRERALFSEFQITVHMRVSFCITVYCLPVASSVAKYLVHQKRCVLHIKTQNLFISLGNFVFVGMWVTCIFVDPRFLASFSFFLSFLVVFIYFMHMNALSAFCLCVTCICGVLRGLRRGCWIPGTGSTTPWVLGVEGGFCARAAVLMTTAGSPARFYTLTRCLVSLLQ